MTATLTGWAAPEAEERVPGLGDFFYCSWGYDQTNINYYQVTATTAKTVTVRPVCSRIVDEDRNITHVVPVRDGWARFDVLLDGYDPENGGTSKRCTLRHSRWGWSIPLCRDHTASLWESWQKTPHP